MKIGSLSLTTLLLCLLILPALSLHAQGEWSPEGATFERPRLMITPSGIDTVWFSLQWARKDSDPQFRSMYQDMLDEALRELPPKDTLQTSSRRANARYAKNIAFVLTANRKPELWWSKPLDPAVRADLKSRLLLSLSRINPNVDAVLQYTEWQWRTKELIDYLCAYDMALGMWLEGPEMEQARASLQKFAGLLYQEATREIAGQSFFTLVRNNHALMVCGALGAAAIVLNDAGTQTRVMKPENWMAAALYWSDDLLWRAEDRLSEPDVIAGYAEGPHYLRYAMLNLLPFWRGLRNVYPVDTIEFEYRGETHRIPHPFSDTATRMLAVWATGIMTPDGLLPPIEDTFVDEAFPELVLLDEERYFVPINSPYTTLVESLQSTVDMRANYMATGIVISYPEKPERWADPLPPITLLRHAGNASIQIPRLIPSAETAETTLHLGILAENGRARIEGGGHNQSDAASFYLNYGRRRLALDPGYLSYARRDEVASANHHNMILVDGLGPPPGSVGSVGGADAWVDTTLFGIGRLDPSLFSGARLLQLQANTAYLGARISRRFFLVENRSVVILDEVESDDPHRYTWQVHGIDGRVDRADPVGSFSFELDRNEARWIGDSAALSAHVVATDPTTTVDSISGVHEVGYEREAPHVTMQATTGETRQVRFLSVLHPTPFLSTSVVSNASSRDVSVEIDGRHLWSMNREKGDHELRDAGVDSFSVTTDADLVNITVNPDDQLQWIMMEEGSRVTIDGIDHIVSDTINTIHCFHHWGNELHVRFARGGTISIMTGFAYPPWLRDQDNPALNRYERVPVGNGLYRLDICVDEPTTLVFRHYLDVSPDGALPDELDLSRAE